METTNLPTDNILTKFRELSATEKGRNQDKIIQFDKNGTLLTYSKRSGILTKFFAKVLSEVFRVDFYSKFKISNPERQQAAADCFYKIMRENYHFSSDNNSTAALRLGKLAEDLTNSGANSVENIFAHSNSELEQEAGDDIAHALSGFADISNFDSLEEDEKNALQSVYDKWKETIDVLLKYHGISQRDKNNLLARMITDGKPLLQEITNKNTQLAAEYLEQTEKLGSELQNYILYSTSPEAKLETAMQGANELMLAFSNFSKLANRPATNNPASSALHECAMFPVLLAANKLRNDKKLRGQFASGGGAHLGAVLRAASDFNKSNPRVGEGLLIFSELSDLTFADPVYQICADLEPIRDCLNLTANMLSVSKSFDHNTHYANNRSDAKNNWVSNANKFFEAHGYLQNGLQHDPDFFSRIESDEFVQLIFNKFTNLEWEKLDRSQKLRGLSLCKRLLKAAISSRLENVEDYFKTMQTYNRSYILSPGFARDAESNFSKALTEKLYIIHFLNEKAEMNKIASAYIKTFSCLQTCAKLTTPNTSVAALSIFFASETGYSLNIKSIEPFLSQDSKHSLFLASCRYALATTTAPEGIDPEDYNEVLSMDILRNLIFASLLTSEKYSEIYKSADDIIKDNSILQTGSFSEEYMSSLKTYSKNLAQQMEANSAVIRDTLTTELQTQQI